MIIKKIVWSLYYNILELEWRENTFPEINLIKTFFVFISLMGKVRGGKTELKTLCGIYHLLYEIGDMAGFIRSPRVHAWRKKKHTSVSFHIPGRPKYIYLGSKLLVPVFFFAESDWTSLWANWAEQHAQLLRWSLKLHKEQLPYFTSINQPGSKEVIVLLLHNT